MILFKCKICGGNLEVDKDTNIASCAYCGSTMTIPRLDDERRVNLYDRADHFRRGGAFDKAISIYEKILEEDQTDAEAYWSLVLCKYGIEYVKDPATGQYTPTCNRAQLTSIFADEDYKAAINYAPASAKSIYEAEARVIDNVVKGIVEISSHEDPFDVFICYKESDANGRRTPDSVLAQDIYHQLQKEGFNVFFSRITLENKLGTEYEPYIFAALNSAAVMVAVGTKPEYFQAPWVKNEWSRYLSSIKSGAKKTLIPAYRDMDPYDLPEDFSHLQAQNMSRLGFMQDLIHGIKKIIGAKPEVMAAAAGSAPINTDSLLDRAFLNLEYGEWQSAQEALERYLDQHPRSAKAHIGKLMVELRLTQEAQLASQTVLYGENANYQKAVRFADDGYRSVLEHYHNTVAETVRVNELEAYYTRAMQEKYKCNTPASFHTMAIAFQKISGYKDADKQAEDCLKREKELTEQKRISDEQLRLEQQKQKALFKKIVIFASAVLLLVIVYCFIYSAVSSSNEKKQATEASQQQADSIQKQYETALASFEAGDYLTAGEQFSKIPDYLDSADKVFESFYRYAENTDCQNFRDYQLEILIYTELEDYKDSQDKRVETMYQFAQFLLNNNYPDLALGYLGRLGDYKDARDLYLALSPKLHSVAAGNNSAFFLTEAGEVFTSKMYSSVSDNKTKLNNWSDVIQVVGSFSNGIGLKRDGTVLLQDNSSYTKFKSLGEQSDLIAISASTDYAVGLKKDGTIVVSGYSASKLNTEGFTDLVAVAVSKSELMGIKADGTVVASFDLDPEWTDIVSIQAGDSAFIGLTASGSVKVYQGDSNEFDTPADNNVVMAKASRSYLYLLLDDGTVKALGKYADTYNDLPKAGNIFYLNYEVIGFDLNSKLFVDYGKLNDSLHNESIPHWDYVNPATNKRTS